MTDFKKLYIHALAWLLPFIYPFLLVLAVVNCYNNDFWISSSLLSLLKQVFTCLIIFPLPLQPPFPCSSYICCFQNSKHGHHCCFVC